MEKISNKSQLSVKTDVFEGPLELLLDLIEKRKLLINDISLATVTDDFMTEVAKRQELSLPNTTHFVVLAATLLLIKSKSLLPTLDLSSEEEDSIEDLEERLRLYQIYREAAKTVEAAFGKKVLISRRAPRQQKVVFRPDTYTTLSSLKQAMTTVISDLPVTEVKPKVRVKPTVTLEEMIGRLQNRIEKQVKTSLQDLVGKQTEKTTVIVGFLAVLESVKQGSILVAQLNRFDDIEIESVNTSVPRYY